MACAAGTLYRNYFVNGTGQRGKHQLNLLHDVELLVENSKHRYWEVRNGYCLPVSNSSLEPFSNKMRNDAEFNAAVRANVRVGIHWGTNVTGHAHDVTQVFASALPINTPKALR